jgi:hypothetical protein
VQVDADEVLREQMALAHSDIGDVIDFTGDEPRPKAPRDVPKHARRAISSMKVRRSREGRGPDAPEVEIIEITFWDKPKALRDLGEPLGL